MKKEILQNDFNNDGNELFAILGICYLEKLYLDYKLLRVEPSEHMQRSQVGGGKCVFIVFYYVCDS